MLAAELDKAELLATPERPEPRGMVFSDLASLTYLDGVLTYLLSRSTLHRDALIHR